MRQFIRDGETAERGTGLGGAGRAGQGGRGVGGGGGGMGRESGRGGGGVGESWGGRGGWGGGGGEEGASHASLATANDEAASCLGRLIGYPAPSPRCDIRGILGLSLRWPGFEFPRMFIGLRSMSSAGSEQISDT